MMTIGFNGTDQQVAAMLRSKGPQIADALQEKMQALHIALANHIVADKLSGQVLKNRTGQLRRAINQQTVRDGDIITSSVGVDPTAPYGKVQEYGGTFTIKEHMRRSTKGNMFPVMAHSATFPERSFLRSGYSDMKQQILDGLQEVVAEAAQAL